MSDKLTLSMWKSIPGLVGYEASDQGQIRSLDRKASDGSTRAGKVLKQKVMKNGYHTFRTTGVTHLVSRCVLHAFTGFDGQRLYACHNNGDKSDNRLGNLRWDTPSGNQADRIKHGTASRGEDYRPAKLSNAQVAAIRADQRICRLIAVDYGVSESHVGSIKAGKQRKYG